MTEANPMHHDLLHALLPLIPRTTYQDARRLNTFVWAIVGLCLTHTVRLSAWAEVTQSRAQYAASRERRFSRWLHHPGIVPSEWYRPVIQAALTDWPANQRLYVALDTTALTPFVLIRASLVSRGRAIPLAWRAMHHRSTKVSFEAYQPVLDQVHALLPANQLVTLLADRGFVHERLLHTLRKFQWHFRLRLPAILGVAVGPVSLALAALLEQPDDPWFVASSEPTDEVTLEEYGLRFDIERCVFATRNRAAISSISVTSRRPKRWSA